MFNIMSQLHRRWLEEHFRVNAMKNGKRRVLTIRVDCIDGDVSVVSREQVGKVVFFSGHIRPRKNVGHETVHEPAQSR